jgi:hypothetical protein
MLLISWLLLLSVMTFVAEMAGGARYSRPFLAPGAFLGLIGFLNSQEIMRHYSNRFNLLLPGIKADYDLRYFFLYLSSSISLLISLMRNTELSPSNLCSAICNSSSVNNESSVNVML